MGRRKKEQAAEQAPKEARRRRGRPPKARKPDAEAEPKGLARAAKSEAGLITTKNVKQIAVLLGLMKHEMTLAQVARTVDDLESDLGEHVCASHRIEFSTQYKILGKLEDEGYVTHRLGGRAQPAVYSMTEKGMRHFGKLGYIVTRLGRYS
jgi:DNA-binding PadR family transcriptional regulator